MKKALSFVSVLTVIFGCVSVKEAGPRPEPAARAAIEPSCGCRPGRLRASPSPPWEWRESRDAGCCRRTFFHIITAAYVEIVLAEAPDPGSFPASVSAYRREMDGQGYEVLEEPVVLKSEDGRSTASLRYRGTKDLGHLRGKIVFRESRTPGTVLVFFGLWHYINEADAQAAFDGMVLGADDLPPEE